MNDMEKLTRAMRSSFQQIKEMNAILTKRIKNDEEPFREELLTVILEDFKVMDFITRRILTHVSQEV